MSGCKFMQWGQTLMRQDVVGEVVPNVDIKHLIRWRGTEGKGQSAWCSRAKDMLGSLIRGGLLLSEGSSSKKRD
jgi:hypothetical protein